MKRGKESDCFSINWYAASFNLDRRTVIARIRKAGIEPSFKIGKAYHYQISKVAPLLILGTDAYSLIELISDLLPALNDLKRLQNSFTR